MVPEALSESLAVGLSEPAAAEPAALVIFGGAGDLAHRKLLPALYNLHLDGLMPPRFAAIGLGRSDLTDDGYRAFAKDGIARFSRRPPDTASWETFAKSLFFMNASLQDPAAFASLGARLDTIEHDRGLTGNRIYYLAVPPSMFVPTVRNLARARFVTPGPRMSQALRVSGDLRVSGPQQSSATATPFARLIVEKPIGHDLASARAIDDAIAEVFDETQIYRIDHYLGKETVQNILVLRFANSIFEPLFNQRYIDHVQLTVAEEEGVGTRAGYYEQAGALRDMVQNHLLQLLALVAMEPPRSLDPDVVRDEKLEVIQSLRPIEGEAVDTQVVRGQYAAGFDLGAPVRGYREESGVDPGSTTETYVALKVFIDNWRWAGVPFFLRTGKRLPKRASEISIHLKEVPPILFNAAPLGQAAGCRADPRSGLASQAADSHPARGSQLAGAPRDGLFQTGLLDPNVLSIRIQPDEGFALTICSKIPGPRVRIYPVKMDFRYGSTFGNVSPEAYERLLLDVMAGDPTLFMRRDAVEAAWRWVTPILERWSTPQAARLATYAAGEWGPVEAERLARTAGRDWRNP